MGIPAIRDIILVAAAAATVGCQMDGAGGPGAYRTIAKDPRRDTQAAREHNAQAVDLLKANRLADAERHLHEALSADLFFGPAHNNLGTVYYRRKEYYLAAWEFQYACKLMAKKAEPRSNLGLVFEAVGKLDDATKWYEEALQIEPEDPEVIANLARIYVRRNRKDAKTRKLLEDIVMRDGRPGWIAWAKERLALMGSSQPKDTKPSSESEPK